MRPRTIPELLALAPAVPTAEPCPELERIAKVAAGESGPAEREAVRSHAASCADCATELELAERLLLHSPVAAGSEAAQDAALARIASRLAEGTWKAARPPAVIVSHPASMPAQRAGRHGNRAPWLAAASLVLLAGAGAAWWLATSAPRPLPPPAQSGPLRGSTLRLVAPFGEVETIPTSFTWDSVPGAVTYELSVFAVDGERLATQRLAPSSIERADTAPGAPAVSAELGGARELLLPGVRYEWQVAAIGADGVEIVRSPRTSFRIRAGGGP